MNDPSQPGQTTPSAKLQTPPNLHWVRDADFTLVIDEQKGIARQLEGDAAALWGWLCMGLSPSQCARLLAAMNDLTSVDADLVINQHLCEWQEAGLLEDSGQTQ
ncbi:MAG: hypothetical protein HND47_11730 [Chloroflexi bacterium]|nr:hypothetical protein [Chloroflexota bacterium]